MAGTAEADLYDALTSFSACLFVVKDGCNTGEIPFTLAGSLQRDFKVCDLENI